MTDEESKNIITEWGFKPSVRLVALISNVYSKGRIDKSDEMSESLDISYHYIKKSQSYNKEAVSKSKAWDKLISEDNRINEESKLKGLGKQEILAAKVIASSLIIKEYKEGGFKNE